MKAITFPTTIFLLFAFSAGGCGKDSQQRLEVLQRSLAATEQRVAEIKPVVAAIQAEWLSLRAALDDPNQASNLQGIAVRMKSLEAALASKKPELDLLLKNEAAYKVELDQIAARGNAGAGDEMEAYGKGVSALAPLLPPPWNLILGTLASVVTAIGGVLVRGRLAQTQLAQKEKDIGTLQTGIDEIVAGGERFKAVIGQIAAPPGVILQAFKDAQRAAQETPTTAGLVAQAKVITKMVQA